MTDRPRPPEIDQTLTRIKGMIGEGTNLKPGARTYKGDTGTITASGEKVDVEITVRPKADG